MPSPEGHSFQSQGTNSPFELGKEIITPQRRGRSTPRRKLEGFISIYTKPEKREMNAWKFIILAPPTAGKTW